MAARYDEWKCSFRFPLLMSAFRDQKPLRYVLDLGDLKGSIVFWIYRLDEEMKSSAVEPVPPFEDEISNDQMGLLREYIVALLRARAEAMVELRQVPLFFRKVHTECLIYGVKNGDMFVRTCKSHEEYDAIRNELTVEFRDSMRRQKRQRLQILLDSMQGVVRD